MTMRRVVTASAVAVLLVLLRSEPTAAQCAMCRRALESPEAQHLAAAFRSGILFLLPVPFATFAAVAMMAVRRQRKRQAQLR